MLKVQQRDFGPDRYHEIPPHGRWQHFEVGGKPRIQDLITQWKHEGLNITETTRGLIDLFFVSVLLDAGAGDNWRYTEPGTQDVYERSEGIAVASLHMFTSLAFTAGADSIPKVDGMSGKARGLLSFTDDGRQGVGQLDGQCSCPGIPGDR